jgi:molybdopterin molybdotransferase
MNGLPDYDQALNIALQTVRPLHRIEEIELAHASGRVIAEDVVADRDLPPFNRAQMDGYAVRATDFRADVLFVVAHTIAAGASADVSILPGQCVAIATGAPLPDSVDAVIPHELSDRGDRTGNGAVRFTLPSVERGHAVHHRGSDAKAGAVVLQSGTLINSHSLGIAAAVGRTSLNVRVQPRVRVLTSGDEIVPPGVAANDLAPHQIRNSNALMIVDLVRRFGAIPTACLHVRDERQPTIDAVREAVEAADLVLTIGGVSAGDRDHFPAAFQTCGIDPVLRGASIQPGRPIHVASGNKAVVVALPGNPVSALACACLFVWPIIRALLGLDPALPWRTVKLLEPVKPNATRRAFRPATLRSQNEIVIPPWAGSGDLVHTAATHGLAELPVQAEPVAAGRSLRFLPWP